MNKWNSSRCAWEKECSRPVTGTALGERQIESTEHKQGEMQRKGYVQVQGHVKKAGGAVKWRADDLQRCWAAGGKAPREEGRQAERRGYVSVASSTYFSILPSFPVNNHSAVTLSGLD